VSTKALRHLLFALGLFLVISIGIILFAPDFEVRVAEAKVRQSLDEKLPYSTEELVTIVISDARVEFVGDGEDGRVRVRADFDVSGFALTARGCADSLSGVRYAGGKFYLKDLNKEDLVLVPDDESSARIAGLNEGAKELWGRIRDNAKSENSRAPEAMDRMLEEFRPILAAELKSALGRIPIYDLSGTAAGSTAKLC